MSSLRKKKATMAIDHDGVSSILCLAGLIMMRRMLGVIGRGGINICKTPLRLTGEEGRSITNLYTRSTNFIQTF